MSSDRIMAQWQSFSAAVMPLDAHPNQVREMRRAFFAGAGGMLTILMDISRDEISLDQGEEIVEAAMDEYREFVRRVSAGEL
jgi:hypothetical protein